MADLRHAGSVLAVCGFAVAAALAVPRGLDAGWLLAHQDDPAAISDRAIARSFTPQVAAGEITAALDGGDVDLAVSFVELARDRGVAIDPEVADRVAAATAPSATASRQAQHFARGLLTGQPEDGASLAGTALGDLFVFGDIRDALREGTRLVAGEPADRLVLGLAGAGIAVTAGTYVMFGAAAPARAGVSLVKAARKSGALAAPLAVWLTRAAREAVKLRKAEGLVELAGDLGRVQAKAGTRAALDGLKVAEGPREVSRLAKLAEKEGGKTRAILRLAGRAAIAFTYAAIDLAGWLFGALVSLIGLCAAIKGAAERTARKVIRMRKARRERRRLRAAAILATAPSAV